MDSWRCRAEHVFRTASDFEPYPGWNLRWGLDSRTDTGWNTALLGFEGILFKEVKKAFELNKSTCVCPFQTAAFIAARLISTCLWWDCLREATSLGENSCRHLHICGSPHISRYLPGMTKVSYMTRQLYDILFSRVEPTRFPVQLLTPSEGWVCGCCRWVGGVTATASSLGASFKTYVHVHGWKNGTISNIHCRFWSDSKKRWAVCLMFLWMHLFAWVPYLDEGKWLLTQLCIHVASNALNTKKDHKDDQRRGLQNRAKHCHISKSLVHTEPRGGGARLIAIAAGVNVIRSAMSAINVQ